MYPYLPVSCGHHSHSLLYCYFLKLATLPQTTFKFVVGLSNLNKKNHVHHRYYVMDIALDNSSHFLIHILHWKLEENYLFATMTF